MDDLEILGEFYSHRLHQVAVKDRRRPELEDLEDSSSIVDDEVAKWAEEDEEFLDELEQIRISKNDPTLWEEVGM